MIELYRNWCLRKAAIKYQRLADLYSGKESSVLDVGSGNGALAKILVDKGYQVQALDVKDKSAFSEIHPRLYDGKTFPFRDDSFDMAQIITVLHHAGDHRLIINEAKRVAKRIIIMEDIYSNSIQKCLTFFFDSLNNWEFLGHPHSNRTDTEWRQLFDELELELVEVKYHRFLMIFSQVTYLLERRQ
jgi:ubiquinone/menaquinone biosynthesis C-methylase UbiE